MQSSSTENEEDCICNLKSCTSENKSSRISSAESDDAAEVVNISLWESILRRSDEKMSAYNEWVREQKASEPRCPPQDGSIEFLDKEIFPLLLQAMRIMLRQAAKWDALRIQKCRFNGLDFLAEFLWNTNPRYPKRSQNWFDLFNIPPFRLWLKLNPRPIFPKSWLWSREEGALIIQKWVRGWLIRKREDVQEMRLFWKAIVAEMEQEATDLGITYSELLEKKRQEKMNEPCERYRKQWLSEIANKY